MSTPVVRLGEQTLGSNITYGWDLTYGVSPAEQTYVLSAARAAALPLGKQLALEITGVRKPLKVEHVYALDVGAGPNPQQRSVRVADRRWLWPRQWVSASFNVRRASGSTTLQVESGQPVELTQIDTTIRFAKWSLDPPEDGAIKWTAARVLDYVFSALGQPWRQVGTLPQIDILDLVLEDNGAAAVERVLAYLPGADVYIDLDGTAVVQDTAIPPNGSEGAEATQTRGGGGPVVHPGLARKHVGLGGDVVTTVRKALRPSSVTVLFTPEVEVRFDSPTEGGSRTRDTPALVNVAASPDLTITLGDGSVVARGSYVPLDTLFTAWGSFGILAEALSMQRMADFGTGGAILEQTYSRAPGGIYDPVSGARARTAVDAWRALYQIDERYVQRLAAIRASRVAILNPATGTRARSEVYCDFLRRPNKKNPSAKGEIQGLDYGWYGRGYSTLLADSVAAPATVSVVSETAGVIRITAQLDPWGTADAIILGYPRDTQTPKNDGDAEANRTGTDAFAQWAACKLTTDFQVATVLTVVPASPNNLTRFHKVEVGASSAGSDGDGPPVTVRIFPGIMTARFAWSDAQAEAIKGAILRGDPRPDGLLVNQSDVQAVAEAAAKAVYAGLADTPDTRSGAVSVDMDPEIRPTGTIGRVRHGVNNGLTTTLVAATGITRPAGMWRFLPASVRQTILRNGLEVES